ncbi:hypothetical protein MKX03_019449 [Papaver bracteatum]|nr:hypothetical protein MKX03_019449 [Papaver bracteatum]
MNDPDSVPHSINQEIGRIRHKYEIPMRIKSVVSQFLGRIDDQVVYKKQSSTLPKPTEPSFWGGSRASNANLIFIPLFRHGTHRPQAPPFIRGTRKMGERQESKKTPSGRLPYSTGPYLFLCAAVLKAEFYVPYSKQVRPIQFLREQEKCQWVKNRKSLSIKQLTRGMSGRRSLLDVVQLAETRGTTEVISPQISQGTIGRSLTIGHKCNDPEVVIVYSEGGRRNKGTLGGIFQQRIPHTDRIPYQKNTSKASGSRSH